MIKTIPPKEAHKLLQSGDAVLIDVREPDEFSAEHIAYALSIPLSMFKEQFQQLSIPKDKKVLIQCLKGARGEQACVFALDSDKIENEIHNVQGGITEWKNQGLPVVSQDKSNKISIFRQVQIIVGSLITGSVILGFTGYNAGFVSAGILGAALCFSGLTGWCGLAKILSSMSRPNNLKH
jgi:rhodanese-related sulfurtransferase